MRQYNPENPGDYKHSAVFASYARIIRSYGAIRFTLSGYSRSTEFSIKDSICKKMSSNCSGDGLATQPVCDIILSKDHFQQLLKADPAVSRPMQPRKLIFVCSPPTRRTMDRGTQSGGSLSTTSVAFHHRAGQR